MDYSQNFKELNNMNKRGLGDDYVPLDLSNYFWKSCDSKIYLS